MTNIRGTGIVDASVVWRVFECAHPGCDAMLKISEDAIERADSGETELALVTCPECGCEQAPETIERAARWKYCRVCEWLQPLENFHKHKPSGRSWRSGRQLECKVCKNTRINPDLNPKRTSDQHREAAQRRRLYSLLSGEQARIDSKSVFDRFGGRCFNCGRALEYQARGKPDFSLDHTLPVKYLWPISSDNATLLCGTCNNVKHDKWPSEFYQERDLRQLAFLTNADYRLISGPPQLNMRAVDRILIDVNAFLAQWIKYPDEIKKVHDIVRQMLDIDICERATVVPDFLRHAELF